MIFPCIICFTFSSGYLRSWQFGCPSYGAQMNKSLLIALAIHRDVSIYPRMRGFPMTAVASSPLPPFLTKVEPLPCKQAISLLGTLRKLQASLGRAGHWWTFPAWRPSFLSQDSLQGDTHPLCSNDWHNQHFKGRFFRLWVIILAGLQIMT